MSNEILFPYTAYLLFSLGAVTWALSYAKRHRKSTKRWGLVSMLVVLMIPFWDWLPTVVAHKYYCEKDAGLVVYKSLGQWNAENLGVLKELESNIETVPDKQIDSQRTTETYLNSRFKWVDKREGPLLFNRWMHQQEAVDVKTGVVLASLVDFSTSLEPHQEGLSGWKFWLVNNHCSGWDASQESMNLFKLDISGRVSNVISLDISHNGIIDILDLAKSVVYFDIHQNGTAVRTSWLTPQDGLLALDMNGNGVVDDRGELFGTVPPQYSFERLAELADQNHDNIVDANDPMFSKIRVWMDANSDGISQVGELKTLSELGITSIRIGSRRVIQPLENGNKLIATGGILQNGQLHLAEEIQLDYNPKLTDANPVRSLNQMPVFKSEVYQVPWLRGYGKVPSLQFAYQNNAGLRQAANDLIAQGAIGILQNFDTFMVKWISLDAAHIARGVIRTELTDEDKIWMLETLVGQDDLKSKIEESGFGIVAGRIINSAYVNTQWRDFVQREASSFAIQATTRDTITGLLFSVNNDRFSVINSEMFQTSLVQWLNTIRNQQDAIFAAVTLDRLLQDGCDLGMATLAPAVAKSNYADILKAAIEGKFTWQTSVDSANTPSGLKWSIDGNFKKQAL